MITEYLRHRVEVHSANDERAHMCGSLRVGAVFNMRDFAAETATRYSVEGKQPKPRGSSAGLITEYLRGRVVVHSANDERARVCGSLTMGAVFNMREFAAETATRYSVEGKQPKPRGSSAGLITEYLRGCVVPHRAHDQRTCVSEGAGKFVTWYTCVQLQHLKYNQHGAIVSPAPQRQKYIYPTHPLGFDLAPMEFE